jgi:hypothetical protein
MKDPFDKEERPYELLGVSPDASIAEVHKAYTGFMRDRTKLPKRHSAAIARDRLSRIQRRIEDELFYYPSGGATGVKLAQGEIPPFDHEPAPPDVGIDVPGLVLHWPVDEADFDPVGERNVQIGNISVFEERMLACLPIEFPK